MIADGLLEVAREGLLARVHDLAERFGLHELSVAAVAGVDGGSLVLSGSEGLVAVGTTHVKDSRLGGGAA
jgi:hypothetical protein